jgi:hypothetical protein
MMNLGPGVRRGRAGGPRRAVTVYLLEQQLIITMRSAPDRQP